MANPTPNLFARPALDQTIAIVQRYQAAAIAAVNPKLDQIDEFHKGPKMRTAYPWLTVSYEGTLLPETSQQSIEQHLVLIVGLETGDFDSETGQETAIDYLRMLDYVFRKLAAFSDWETALPIVNDSVPSAITTPWPTGTVKQVFIERHEQSILPAGEKRDSPALKVTLHLRFDLEES